MPEINNESHNIVSTYDKLIRRTNNGSKYFNTFPPHTEDGVEKGIDDLFVCKDKSSSGFWTSSDCYKWLCRRTFYLRGYQEPP